MSQAVWVPLAVASLGIMGTLAAGLCTQALQGKREQEREELARRIAVEDRWLQDRQQVYAEYLTTMEPWVRWARTLRYSAGKVPRELIDSQLPDGSAFTEAAESLLARMEIIAGQRVAPAARGLWLWTGAASVALAEAHRNEHNRDEFMRGVSDSYAKCVLAMREDLGAK